MSFRSLGDDRHERSCKRNPTFTTDSTLFASDKNETSNKRRNSSPTDASRKFDDARSTLHDDDEYCKETDYIPPYFNPLRPKRRKMNLTDREISKVKRNRMLTDESINIAQNLLLDQCSHLSGLKDTSVGQT